MKYLILTPGYPSEENLYNNAFVHARVKIYIEKGLEIQVFSICKNSKNKRKYQYDGVDVIEGNYKELKEHLLNSKYDKILIHFAWKKTIKAILNYAPQTHMIIWVHGVEALGWYRRLFTFNIKRFYRFLGYIIVNTKQLIFLHHFIKDKSISKEFIFVSEWMKEILEKDSCSKITNYHIIPNVIDNEVFNYCKKEPLQRMNILSIRPYASKKYANDLTVKTILELQKESFFEKLNFEIYGDGRLFDKTLKPIRNLNNVKIHKQFLTQKEIANLHKKNGIILTPTRQDAQGVSMCEAMMSGLVAVTSNNTAIPEYVDIKSGYLANNAKELAYAIIELYNNPQLFLEKSENAHKKMMELCSPKIVIKKELSIIKK